MELDNKNQQSQLPYEKLALIGIDREKADKLPTEVKEKLVSGEVTPLLQVSFTAQNGNVITLPLKLQMALDQTGRQFSSHIPSGVCSTRKRSRNFASRRPKPNVSTKAT